MELLYITNSSNIDEIKKSISLKNIKYLNYEQYVLKKQDYLNKDYLLIIDKNTIKENYIEQIKEGRKPESIILLSDTLDWDKLIETFEKGENFYIKPIKKEDFELFE